MANPPRFINPSDLQFAAEHLQKIQAILSQYIIGQTTICDRLLLGLLTKGHILIEGVPGLAKTRVVNMVAKATQLEFKRIQFTPDLLPSDVIGNLVFNPKTADYFVKQGPIFANLILADEINRSPAKVQSALLEAMQEHQVTIGGETQSLPQPFLVLATQNPIEQEGTYPLPEAQVDRFIFKVVINYPSLNDELKVMDLVEKETTVKITPAINATGILKLQTITDQVFTSPEIKEYIGRIINATRFPKEYGLDLQKSIAFGASPRGSLAFLKATKALALLNGRDYVIPEDVKELRYDILRHRIIMTYEAEVEGLTPEHIIDQIFQSIKVP